VIKAGLRQEGGGYVSIGTGQEYGSIDRFRIIAAIIIVGIHTYPMASVSEVANFYFVHVLGRVAVPFFLMVTGYFLLSRYLVHHKRDTGPLINFVKKTGIIYALATLLYLPLSIYAGHYTNYAGMSLLVVIVRNIVFDGTFYHLWYLPAVIIGVLIVYALGRGFSLRLVFAIAVLLYFIGLFGDNYFGVIYGVLPIRNAYEVGFRVFSFTRNGLFYAPIFLVIGAAMAKQKNRVVTKHENRVRGLRCVVGLVVSLAFLMFEGYVLRRGDFSRHSSMYIALLPTMFFLFSFLLLLGGKAAVGLRSISMGIFILHPLIIIVVRGVGRVFGLTQLLVENSVVFFIAVCGLSVVVSVFCNGVYSRYKGRAYV